MWQSESPTIPTGYGNVTRYLCTGLAARNMDVHIISWEVNRETELGKNCIVHPAHPGGFGVHAVHNYLLKLRPDYVVTFGDPTWLSAIVKLGFDGDIRRLNGKWIAYFTIDGETSSGEMPKQWKEMLSVADVRVTVSHYAVEICRRSGVDAHYVPHGVATDLFSPPMDKEAAKAQFGYKGKFVILSDARNQPRKMLPALLTAFAEFSKNKNDVLLHLHTDPKDPWAKGDIKALIKQLGIDRKVCFTEGFKITQGITVEKLASIYKACDVHLLASAGESFGLPTLQACSTGLVPLGVDYSANRELIEGHGALVKVESFKIGRFGLKLATIDTHDCADKLEKYYGDPQLLAENSRKAREFSLAYSWDRVSDMFLNLLQTVSRSKPRSDPINPWVMRGTVVLGHQTATGDDALVSRIRPLVKVHPGVRISMNVVAPKTDPIRLHQEEPEGVVAADDVHQSQMVACISVWNEAQTIVRAIKSLEGKVERIIVVDGRFASFPGTGWESSDGTLEAIQSLKLEKVEIIHAENVWPNEAQKRNSYMKKLLDGDWMFHLDGDEYLVGELPSKDTLTQPFYRVEVKTIDRDSSSSFWYPRLIRVHRGYHYHTHHARIENSSHTPIFSAEGMHEPRLANCYIVNDHTARNEEREKARLQWRREYIQKYGWNNA